MRIVVVGDVMLDRDVTGRSERLSPDAPVPVVDVEHIHASPGGAGLAALLCGGRAGGLPGEPPDVVLVTPLAEDAAAAEIRTALAGIEIHALGHEGGTRTKTRIRSSGQTLVRVDEGGPGAPVHVDPARLSAALDGAEVILVSDYGGGVTRDPVVRRALAEAAVRVPVVWDPHPRGGNPVPGCTVVTPNLAEARAALAAMGPAGPARDETADDELAEALRTGWDARSVAVTAGARGAFLATTGTAELLPAVPVDSSDPCGAGDRFAAAVAVSLASGASVHRSIGAAVAAAAQWVEAGGAAAFRDGRIGPEGPAAARRTAERPLSEDPYEAAIHTVAATRARGGTVVATGGCFDLLHPGHLETLRQARALGDTLVVLLNSDDSVRRLKGPARPVVGQLDRAALLMGLRDVDGVIVFHEDDPRAALDRLRPEVWVKGGDYRPEDLPEAPLVRSWGGRVEVLPYLPGRSTTGIVERMTAGNVDAH
ncbi:bifunctional protein HldE [Pseudoclavibacter endophyticus]|uniref:Bifunctional heptose 7-phosphate kinase/heptose 1-phosphate adenyltransferase n=1 Tax=Pseudoclavibacter endophyticus TaxID=1778590 RepID=A0A6H9WUF5_9MICO|nr:PfkB family carbohydrate kinase [Pseudoclavibacter endophyticus]KAB1650305.1 bifunctional heptose 7-phosphate kinase/heptose 1-phosphate adenyltransferase [Pseudoclavibacter endophyticus]GGA55284.1 bifunctional protein HldE [Pseudoclavibacter endophyticus]